MGRIPSSVQRLYQKSELLQELAEQYSSLALLKNTDLSLISIATLVDKMSVYLIIPLLPIYLQQTEVSLFMVGVIIASEKIARSVFSTPLGYISDRFNRQFLITFGTLISGVSVALLGFVRLPILFVALRMVDGLAGAIRGPATRAYIGDRFPEEQRGKAMGANKTIGMLGIALGPAMGGLTAGITNISVPFILLGSITAVVGLLVGVALSRTEDTEDEADDDRKSLFDHSREEIKNMFSVPVLVLALSTFLSAFAISIFNSLFSVLLKQKFTIGPEYIGTVWSIFGVSLLVFMPIGGTLADKRGRKRSMVLSRAAWGMIFILVAVATSPIIPPALLVVGGLASALGGPAMGALSYEVAPDQFEGTLIGFYSTLGAIGASLGPIIGGYLSDVTTVATTLIIVSSLVFLDTTSIYLGLRTSRSNPNKSEQPANT